MPSLFEALPTPRFRLAATAALIALAGGLTIAHTRAAAAIAASPSWLERNSYATLARWLEAHQLTCGVGDYWESSILTALSEGKVTVRALATSPDSPLKPFPWLADSYWYGGGTLPEFAVWRYHKGFTWLHFNEKTVALTYGPPLRLERIGPFSVALLLPRAPGPSPTLRCTRASDSAEHSILGTEAR